ncbi:ACP phosphodiesterase [Kushneria marisflavi]|uniref:ACP phosphodiesterase n=1 Tax=Kushneria marisflavi TaxID=157779 RepID=A0A240UKV0_9GAMM|nr:ACP phosphodiesterase [Kushneria marisflavi]ART61703.1 ACP phosphodiesterase [Kushneria marisflavi]RKD86720.1 acyl carrier protein phosphodiesterase [Kushneria marisflavi]
MNFLAHAQLARHGSDLFLLGNLVADGVKGPVSATAHPELARGIRFHRRMDALIDQHDTTLALKRQAPGPQRRVCGIALDIVWDHFLARLHHDEDLNQRVYHVLRRHADMVPERQTRLFDHLCRENWLKAYAGFEFTCRAIAGVGTRLSGPNRLAELRPWLEQEYSLLEESFHEIWPWMQRAACEHAAASTDQ